MIDVDSTLGLAHLRNDYGRPGKAFKPYSYRACRVVEWLRANALPLVSIALAVV